jgi:hypothetical protein
MPDRGRGYVRRDEGILPSDEEMGAKYRKRSTNDPTTLTREIQTALLQELQTAC